MKDEDLIGKTEKEAIDMIKAASLQWRVVAKDNQYFTVTDDYLTNRVNLNIKNDKVIHTKRG